jgi:site-specific DNA recombinase
MNRRNRARRASIESDRHALAAADRAVTEPGPDGAAQNLEAEQDRLRQRLAEAGAPPPVVHPNIAELLRRKVERLAEALDHPEDRREAADALRTVIAGITLRPGPERGELHATLHGDLGTILGWLGHKACKPSSETRACMSSVSD